MSERRDAPDDRVSAYLDGELDATERGAVEELLKSSRAWRAELDAVRSARAAVRSLPVREAPREFWDRVVREGHMVSAPDRRLPARSPFRRQLPWVAVVAAVAASVIAVLSFPSSDRVTPRVPQFSDSHAVRSSESQDPITQLATLGLAAPRRR